MQHADMQRGIIEFIYLSNFKVVRNSLKILHDDSQ